MIPEARQRHGEPSSSPCAVDINLTMTHVKRSRQLPTNHNHASSVRPRRIIREYQVDSPSRKASLSGSWLSRDGPEKRSDEVEWA